MDLLDVRARIQAWGVRVRPAVPLEKIRALEGRLGIELPEEYVSFLTQTGDGWEKQVVRCALWLEMKSLLACQDPRLLREPFPYTDAWVWENQETNPLPGESDEAWNTRVEELLHPTHLGNICLLRGSCGEKFHLILHGACAGEIWQFTDVGIAPCAPRCTFSRWLTSWLADKMALC